MAENAQNGEWDRVLAKRLQKKRRTEVHASGSARHARQAGEAAGAAGEGPGETLLWSSSGGSPDGTSAGTSGGEAARMLDPRDEKKALDILLRRRGAGAGGKVLAVGAVAALVAAVGLLVGTRGPRVTRRLQVVGDLAPPEEEEGPSAGGAGGPQEPLERLPIFHARPFRPGERPPSRRTEWQELGGPLVDLDASPPLR